MRNGLVAATAARKEDARRAADWLVRLGGRLVPLTREDADHWAALVTDGGTAVNVIEGREARGACIGSGKVRPEALLAGGPMPPDTVAISVGDAGPRCVVGVGTGSMRLFSHADDRGRLVSTSFGAITAGLGDRADIDRSYEDFHLGFGFLPDGRTMIKNLTAIPRPSVETLKGERVTEPERSPRSDPDVAVPRDVDGLVGLFLEVLEDLVGDVDRVGVLLGGFDSALVAAGLHRIGKRVSTFTFSFRDPRFDQRHVEDVVSAVDADHHPVPITAATIGSGLDHFPEIVNQPGAQPHYQIQTIAAAVAAREAGVTRLLSGDGCDALFLAYPTVNTRAAATRTAGRIPGPMARAALKLLAPRFVESKLGHVARVARSTLRSSLLEPPASQHLPTQYLDQVTLRRLDRSARPPQRESVEAIRRRLAEQVSDLDAVQRAFDGNSRAGHSQAKVEGAIATSGLPIMSPYKHPDFRAAIDQLPSELTRPGGRLARAEGKPILQMAARESGLLPLAVVDQPKQAPTLAPVDRWFAGPLRSQVMSLLGDLPFEVDHEVVNEILHRKAAEDWYRRRVALSKHALQAIGLLTSYAAFARLTQR